MSKKETDIDVEELKIRKFDPKKLERIRTNPKQGETTILFVGSKRAGKTTMMLDIMKYLRKIPRGIIVTGSLNSAKDFAKVFPDTFIFTDVNDNLIKKLNQIINDQEDINNSSRTNSDRGFFILFDDCGFDQKLAKQEVLRKIFMNGRHYHLQVLYAIQDTKSVPPGIRKNSDIIFIHRENGVKERKKLYEEFAGIVPDMKTFNTIMDHCTKDYRCLVVDRTVVNSNKIEDNIFFYKAKYYGEEGPKFKMGSKEFWAYNERAKKRKKLKEKKNKTNK